MDNQQPDMEEMSVWVRRRINRVFREQAGIKDIPHPEVDTVYERIRSHIVRIVLVVIDRIKKRR